jgi:hypothetical protein
VGIIKRNWAKGDIMQRSQSVNPEGGRWVEKREQETTHRQAVFRMLLIKMIFLFVATRIPLY